VIRRPLMVTSLVAAAVLAVPALASAAPPSSGSWSATAAGGHGRSTWSVSTGSLEVRATAPANLPAGWCTTAYFDWKVASGHMDVRAVRVCRAGASAHRVWDDAASRPTGVHKMRVCTGPEHSTGTCTKHAEAAGGVLVDWRGSLGVTCVSWTRITANGTLRTNSGGSPRSCTS
jgi:hypothetical protein